MELGLKSKALLVSVLGLGTIAGAAKVFDWAANAESQQYVDIDNGYHTLTAKLPNRSFSPETTTKLASQVETFAKSEHLPYDKNKGWDGNLKVIQARVSADRGKSAADIGEGVQMDYLRNGFQILIGNLNTTIDHSPLVIQASIRQKGLSLTT